MLQEFLIAIESGQSCYPPKTLLITANTRKAIVFTDYKLHLYFYLRKILLDFKCSWYNLYKRMRVRVCVTTPFCLSVRMFENENRRTNFIKLNMINVHLETNPKSWFSISCSQEQQQDRCKDLRGRVTALQEPQPERGIIYHSKDISSISQSNIT